MKPGPIYTHKIEKRIAVQYYFSSSVNHIFLVSALERPESAWLVNGLHQLGIGARKAKKNRGVALHNLVLLETI